MMMNDDIATCTLPALIDIATMGFKQCPVCASWETTRHTEAFRVWFTCNRCGAVFS